MRFLSCAILALAVVFAFSGAAQARALKGQAVVGKYAVGWGELGKQPARGPKTLLFFFAWKDPTVSGGVSEADWQKEAARQKMSVADLKSIMGSDVYRSARGGVAICTMGAVKKGLCGKKLGLSEKARAEMAAAVLAKDGRCASTGFDPVYHRQVGAALGAIDDILVLRAECGR